MILRVEKEKDKKSARALDKKRNISIIPFCLKSRQLTSKPQRAHRTSRFSQVEEFCERAAVSSLKIIFEGAKKRLTVERDFVSITFCLGREKVVCRAMLKVVCRAMLNESRVEKIRRATWVNPATTNGIHKIGSDL